MTKIRGRAILGVLSFLKSQPGPSVVPSTIDQLPESARQVFDRPIKASAWYPYDVYTALLAATDRFIKPAPDRDLMAEVGYFGLGRDTRNVLQILRVFASVEGLVHRGFGSWGNYLWGRHCSNGTVVLADHGKKWATMGLEGFPDIAPAHCALVRGYLEEMGRAVGATEIDMTEIECIHRGDERCAFRGAW